MKRTAIWLSSLLALMIYVFPITDAEAFWAVRGARGGFAVGGLVRPPVVVDHYYARGCYRCAPLYAPGAVAAGAAIGAAAATAGAAAATAHPPPAPSSSTAAAPASPPASAGSASAQPACVSSLSADARMIYNASRSAGATAANVRDVVTAQTRALVMAGKIPQSTAKTDAQAAGQCLAQAK